MKKLLILSMALLPLCFDALSQAAPTVELKEIPNWISEKGYWVTESNLKSPDTCTIFFYNNDHVLVYKERLEGIVLNIKRYKVRMRLKSVLEKSIINFEANKTIAENQSLVANLYRYK